MSGVRRVLRWEIPIDDADHELPPGGPVLAVAGHRDYRDRVEVWTLDGVGPDGASRVFRVFGTGQPIPPEYVCTPSGATPGRPPSAPSSPATGGEPPATTVVLEFGGREVDGEALVAAIRRALGRRVGGGGVGPVTG